MSAPREFKKMLSGSMRSPPPRGSSIRRANCWLYWRKYLKGALIQEILVEHSIQADKRRISLRSQIDGELPTAWVDPRRFNQVLSNLLSNALKFSDDGGDIEVDASRGSDNDVKAWVKDTGIGISSDEIGQIFVRKVPAGFKRKKLRAQGNRPGIDDL